MLVIGMAGLPAEPYADAVSRSLLCDEGREGQACGRCAACRLMAADSHPDLFVLSPIGSQVRIDGVRDALAWASYRPQVGARRVVRLRGADRMGAEAAVAALKGVEEPNAAVHWVLSADAPGWVSSPLRSRCMALPLRPVEEEQVALWLEGRGVDGAQALSLARACGGFPALALEAAGLAAHAEAGDDVEALVGRVRRDVRARLREGGIGAGEARKRLRAWARIQEGFRRGTAPRLLADAASELTASDRP